MEKTVKFFSTIKYLAIPFSLGIAIYLVNYHILKTLFILYPSLIPLTIGNGGLWLHKGWIFKIIYVGMLAPLLEELVFRRGILQYFISKKMFYIGLAVSSILFGVWHVVVGWGILKAVNMTIIGIVFGLIYKKYGFSGSLATHYANNLMSLIFIALVA